LLDSGKAEMKPTGVDVIKRVGAVLKEFPDKKVHVDGYTDDVPIRGALLKTFPSNMELSKARAETAMIALEHGGVPKANMTAIGHADTEPVADNTTATGRQKNRRVEIVVQ
jgi:chemotaxis protein MotB